MSFGKLERKTWKLTEGFDEVPSDEISSKDALSNNEKPLGDTFCERDMKQTDYSAMEDDSGSKGNANGIMLPEPESHSLHGDEANDMKVVSET